MKLIGVCGMQMAVGEARDALLALQSEVNQLRSGLHSMTHSEFTSAPEAQHGQPVDSTASASVDPLCDTHPEDNKQKSLLLHSTLGSSWRLPAVTGNTVRGPDGENLGRPGSNRPPGFLEEAGMGTAAHSKHSGVKLKPDVLRSREGHGQVAFVPQQHIVMSVGVQHLPGVGVQSPAVPEDNGPGVAQPAMAEPHSNTHVVSDVVGSDLRSDGHGNAPSSTSTEDQWRSPADGASARPSLRSIADVEGVLARSMIPKPSTGTFLPSCTNRTHAFPVINVALLPETTHDRAVHDHGIVNERKLVT